MCGADSWRRSHKHTHTRVDGAGSDKKQRDWVTDEEKMTADESGKRDTVRKMKWWGNRLVGRQ